VSLLVSGIGPDEEVLIPSMTFIAPVNAIRYVGAWPIFIDSDPCTWQMDIDRVQEFLEDECDFNGFVINKTTGRRVTAVIPVHVLGYCVDLERLKKLCQTYGLRIIEDATESLGASYKGELLGATSTVACFSFNGNKLMTTGGGGMITSRNPEFLTRAKHLTTQAKCDSLEYVHDEVGYNYRLPSLLAALGCAQLEQLPAFIESKKLIAQKYDEAFSKTDFLTSISSLPETDPVPWLYTVLLPKGSNSRPLIAHLKGRNIETRPLWQPNHLSPAHREAQVRFCPVAAELYERAISLPCSSHLDAGDQARVIQEVLSFISS
jgi:perosamine synthetase